MDHPNILLVTFPAHGHVNPSLQFAKRLTSMGVKVTFMTSASATSRMVSKSSAERDGIEFVSFSDGYDGLNKISSVDDFMSSLDKHGVEAVAEIISTRREQGRPFSRVVYTTLIPWAGRAAYSLNAPVTFLWIQPAALFDIYYYYFKGYISNSNIIELPGLQKLEPSDLPSFLLPSSPNMYNFALPLIKESFEMLDRETDWPTVLVNTFEALESEPLRVMEKYKLIPIGPLVPSTFLDGKDPSDKSFGGDLNLIQNPVDYIEWLDSQKESSVIYIAFGSYSEVSKTQVDHLSQGLIMSKKPFLWVIKGIENREKLDEILTHREELERHGKIVPWCTQVEVLSHPSVGCFVTHCGWNSSLESLVSGVPVVALPQWSDQATNAKLLQDYWKTGVKARGCEDGSVIEAEEIKRCLEIAMGGEMRKQAKKWRDLAKQDVDGNGSSTINLKQFIENVIDGQ